MNYKEFNWAPGKVYLEKKDEEEKTENGLIVPESQRKSKNRGLVVAMGAKRVKDEELVGLGLGSTIYYNTAKPIAVEGIEFLEVDVMNIHTWKPSK